MLFCYEKEKKIDELDFMLQLRNGTLDTLDALS
jgi:hypothetical protein